MATKKSTKREISAGGAVLKKEGDKTLWLVIQPKRNKDKPIHWRLPKGIIEKDESTKKAALREVEEEAGIKAEIIEKIGRTTHFYTFKGERIFKIIIFYLMKFLNKVGEPDGIEAKKIEWLSYKEAYERLTFKSEKAILEKAKRILEEKSNQLGLF